MIEQYSKKNLSIAGIIAGLGLVMGFLGQWLLHESTLMDVAFIVIGLDLICFSHDLTMERVIKYNLNYKFYRGLYIFAGLAILAAGILTLMNR